MEEKDLLQNSCGGFPYPVTTQGELESFSCGDKDLDDFFHQDAFLYAEQLLGKTYYFSTTGDDNKTGCRFIVVDAYNKENVLHFYEKNGFKFLYSTESLEKEANHIPEDEHLESRMMYLDLLGYIR